MAAVEITISGVLYDKIARTSQPVVLIGEATLTGLGVGGGPIYPPQPPGGGGGGYPGHPAHPIWRPDLKPEHPIVLPPDRPTDPPIEPPTNPPDPNWEWCWNPNTGWIPAFVAGDKPRPPHK